MKLHHKSTSIGNSQRIRILRCLALEYWRGLASGANFIGKDLRRCLIHDDIVVIWNFPRLPMVRRQEPRHIFKNHLFQLRHDGFRGRVSQLVASLADLQAPSPNDSM